MQDLARALEGDESIRMLGGGNPAHIPAVEGIVRRQMEAVLRNSDAFERMLGNYDRPRGSLRFRQSLAALLRRSYGWPISENNIVLTPGSQMASFYVLNALAGTMPDGSHRRVLLPLAPEYIGYADQCLATDTLQSCRPTFEMLDDHTFKYHIDFDNLRPDDNVAALCVSRPTNPTGNVVTDEEVQRLSDIARRRGVPLIIDNAYGTPFPNIIFRDVAPIWDEHIILLMSLSKLGLPSTRTGIVIAAEEIAAVVGAMNSIVALSNPTIGPAIMEPLLASGEILRISRDIVRPFYQHRAQQALEWAHSSFDDSLPYRLHACEGALFIWLWCEGLPVSSSQIYQRLKSRGVLVVPGEYFFPGLRDPWQHKHECLRINYAHDADDVRSGLAIIADEVRRAYDAG